MAIEKPNSLERFLPEIKAIKSSEKPNGNLNAAKAKSRTLFIAALKSANNPSRD